jgi:hypothetical protein
VAQLVAEPALAVALQAAQLVAVRLLAAAQPQVALVLQLVVLEQQPVVQQQLAVQQRPAQVLPLQLVRLPQLLPRQRLVWWRLVWRLWLSWRLQRLKRPTPFIKTPLLLPVLVPIPHWLSQVAHVSPIAEIHNLSKNAPSGAFFCAYLLGHI